MILKKCDLPVAPDTLPMLVADRVAMTRSMKIGGDMIVSVNENEFICLTQSLRFDSSTWQKWQKCVTMLAIIRSTNVFKQNQTIDPH